MFVGERVRSEYWVGERSLHRRKDLKSERLGCLALGLLPRVHVCPGSEMQQSDGPRVLQCTRVDDACSEMQSLPSVFHFLLPPLSLS